MSELPELPPDLEALFADERDAYPESDVARARVLRRIQASVAFTAVGVGVGGWLLHLTKHAKLWLALTFAVGASAGVAVGETHARWSAPPAPTVTAVAERAAPAPVPRPSAEPTAIPIDSLPSVPSAAPPPPPAATSTLAAEQSLIETARSALARGRADDALRATAEHEKQFPRGRLAEEREMLAIQALVQANRTDDAKARAARFHSAYPSSLYGSAVDALFKP